MDIALPFQIDSRGATATAADADAHLRHLIEEVLFTAPGERVNRPDFGCDVLRMVFAPDSGPLASSTQHAIQGALQQWLGDLIQVEAVRVDSREATIQVSVQYLAVRTQQRQLAQFTRGV